MPNLLVLRKVRGCLVALVKYTDARGRSRGELLCRLADDRGLPGSRVTANSRRRRPEEQPRLSLCSKSIHEEAG